LFGTHDQSLRFDAYNILLTNAATEVQLATRAESFNVAAVVARVYREGYSHMSWFDSIILGIVQGLTEFIPVSSSAHLRIVGELLPGTNDPGAMFTAVTQLGTETAVLIYFWRDIARIASRWFRSLQPEKSQLRRHGRPSEVVTSADPEARMGWLIIVGSVPIVLLGLAFQNAIEGSLRNLWIVASMLIGFGALLLVADLVGRKTRTLTELTIGRGLVFGLAQALALIPGVSRSGGTITAGLFMGFTRSAAARYSFLLALPAVFGSGLYELAKSFRDPSAVGLAETATATGVAFLVGLGVIAFLMRWLAHHGYWPFVVYRVLLGGAVIALLLTDTLTA
jgi:undecaprenyl-diphosphatase